MFWIIINATASLIVAGIVAYKLVTRSDKFTRMERMGMGLVGSGCLLTIGPIMSVYPTPFEDWSAALFRIGLAIYFAGRMLRHRHNNAALKRAASKHLGAKR